MDSPLIMIGNVANENLLFFLERIKSKKKKTYVTDSAMSDMIEERKNYENTRR